MRRVVLFSGGMMSWAAARRTVDAHGPEDVTLLFTDTKMEDGDLYRFLDEAAADVGAPLVRLADGRDIWQVFRDERFLGNTRADPCSKILKRQLARRYVEEAGGPDDVTVVLGLDWTEVHRYDRAAAAWAPYPVESPMIDPPLVMRTEILAELAARAIEPPRLYGLGFAHNNCGGGCVKAGRSQFVQLLNVLPERYAEWEANEESIREHLGADVSILRDRTGGDTKPMTLRRLRESVQAGQPQPMFDFGGCACFEEPEPEEAVS